MKTLHIARGTNLPIDAVTQTFGILGKRGGGKSYTAKVMAEEMMKAGAHICAVDPIGNWWGLRLAAGGKSPGLPITVLGGDYGDLPIEANEAAGELVARLIVEEKASVIIDLSRFRKGEQTRFMIGWAEALYRLNREALHLFIDEADAWAPQRPMGHDSPRLLGAMEDLVRRGRARGLGVTMITQRSASINKDLLTQIEVLIAKRTIAPQDREAIDAWVKVHGTPERREAMMASLPSLPTEEAWLWSPSWLDLFQKVRIRALQTFDSSATPEVGAKQFAPKKLADVDLKRLDQKMAATVERAKQEDPRELRRRIAQLEAEARKATKSPAGAPSASTSKVDPDRLRKEFERGVESARKTLARDLARYEREADRVLSAARRVLEAAHEKTGIAIGLWRESLPQFPTLDDAIANAKKEGGAAMVPPPAVGSIASAIGGVPNRPARQPVTAPANSNEEIGSGPMRLLKVLASRSPAKLTRTQWATLAGMTHTGGTFGTYVSRLRVAKLIDNDGRLFWATDAGVDAAGDVRLVPTSPHQVREMWKQVLGRGPARMIDVLARIPHAMNRDELATACEMTPSGGTFGTYLSRLSANGLIVKTGSSIELAETLRD